MRSSSRASTTTASRLAIALLFAGTDFGGANDRGLTYAAPLRAVLDALKVDLTAD
jgi:hypothetical protein